MNGWGQYIPRWFWPLFGLAVGCYVVFLLRHALTPVFAAFLIAYLLDPLVDRFEARGIPRAVGIVILLVLLLGGFALIALLVIPGVVRESLTFVHELPDKITGLREWAEPRLRGYGVEIPHTFEELRQLVGVGAPAEEGAPPDRGQIASRATEILTAVGTWIWGRTTGVIGIVGTLLIVPVFAFYLLLDFDRMIVSIRDLVPWRFRPFVVDVAKEVDQVLAQFVRGQLLVMLALAILYSTAYSIVGIRLAIPIGIIAGLLSFIPYVGGATALILALLMCLLNWQGWWQVGGVVVAYGIIQVLEGFVITPKIVGDKVGLSAVWVLVALLIGGELFGFLGVLLAVPVAAVCKIFVVRAVAYYRTTDVFKEGAPPAGPVKEILEEEGLPDEPETASEKAEVRAQIEEEAAPGSIGEAIELVASKSEPPPKPPEETAEDPGSEEEKKKEEE